MAANQNQPNLEVNAIAAKVGINSSAETSSHDYKLSLVTSTAKAVPNSYLDTDTALTANSDTKIATQKATKAYADAKIATSYLDTDGTLAANSDSKLATQKATKTYGDRALNTTLNINPLFAPEGFLINGKISVTDSGSGIVVAIKTLADANPSVTDPVYCRIGDTVRSITAALSCTHTDGYNYYNAGSSELATKEIDYFVYLCYSSTESAMKVSYSRIPYANLISDFSETFTNEKFKGDYFASGHTAATDVVVNIGRFAATLSAGAGYTWSVPTFTASNLIQRPIYETRWLTWSPVFTGFSSNPTFTAGSPRYKIIGKTIFIEFVCAGNGTSNATTYSHTFPFNNGSGDYHLFTSGSSIDNGGLVGPARINIPNTSATCSATRDCAGTAWTNSGGKRIDFSTFYEI